MRSCFNPQATAALLNWREIPTRNMADASEMENIKEKICAVGQNAVDNINRLIRLVERPGSFSSLPLSLTTESQSTQGQQPTQPQTRSSCSPYGNNANHGSEDSPRWVAEETSV